MTERMIGVLTVLSRSDRPMTGNQIGLALGFSHGMIGIRQHSHNGKRMGPANRVNFAVTRLEHLGFVQYARRPDGLTGSAYAITAAGREELARQ